MDNWDIVILGGVSDFHAMDWYRAVRKICVDRSVVFLTDSFEAEGFDDLSQQEDRIEKLFIIDNLLPKKMQRWSRPWRMFVKLALLPLQIMRLRRFYFASGKPVVHAHPMYFMFLSRLARIPYMGTPQGDELLINPNQSRLYKYLVRWVLRGCRAVIVDSEQMKQAAKNIAGIEAHVIQNGINIAEIHHVGELNRPRFRVVSNRGMADIYQIEKIIHARDARIADLSITFSYPFADPHYQDMVCKLMSEQDENIGRSELKSDLFTLLKEALLVISIPKSDSSPRSVYEAIFCGCCVAACSNLWIDELPASMRSRIYVVDINNPDWLKEAYEFALKTSKISFRPCEDALNRYDEASSLRLVAERFYFGE